MREAGVQHSIKVVSQRTGLSPHVIRVWEKRYGTVRPERSGGNQRLYSDEDVQRLALLRQATNSGHAISKITQLNAGQLQRLLEVDQMRIGSGPTGAPFHRPAMTRDHHELVAAALRAVTELDAAELERILEEGAVSLGQVALLNQVVAPLVQQIGDGWRAGTLKVAHEHLASAVIRTFLGYAARPMAVHAAAPVLIATTPAGQLHEIGAALVAAAATSQGWRAIYLGASLPAEEIVSVARQNRARAVALSIIHPADDPQLGDELIRLRRMLPDDISLLVGGRSAAAYSPALEQIGATVCDSLGDLTAALDALRQGVG